MKISRTDLKYFIDTLMFLCIFGLTAVGLLLAFVIPEGPARDSSVKELLGIHRHQWANIHLLLSLAFSVFLIVHIALGWNWIRGKTKRLYRKRWAAALALTVVAAVLVPVLFWGLSSKTDPAFMDYGIGSGRMRARAAAGTGPNTRKAVSNGIANPIAEPQIGFSEHSPERKDDKPVSGKAASPQTEYAITGRMNLKDIEKETGIPAEAIVERLRLPAGVSSDETLGRLRKHHAFTLEEVRKTVSSLLEEIRK